jgi:four helix bundle protein
MSKQVLRCGTSIGANIHEAYFGQSRKDFISKMQIALKEAAETEYWLVILTDTGYIAQTESKSIKQDCVELIKMLQATVKTAKQK